MSGVKRFIESTCQHCGKRLRKIHNDFPNRKYHKSCYKKINGGGLMNSGNSFNYDNKTPSFTDEDIIRATESYISKYDDYDPYAD